MATIKPKSYTMLWPSVEAVQWDGTAAGATPIINWILETGNQAARYHDEPKRVPGPGRGITTIPTRIDLDTETGTAMVRPRDYVVRTGQGVFKKYDREVFEASYREV